MKNITLEKKLSYTDEGWSYYRHTIKEDGIEVGYASMVTHPDFEEAYLEDVDVKEEHRNKGIGAAAIKALAKEYGYIYFAPLDENSQRLYDRIAEEEPAYKDHDAIDQGFGIYYLEG